MTSDERPKNTHTAPTHTATGHSPIAGVGHVPVTPGTVFANRYRVFGSAQGGMGRVYFADDLKIGRDGTPLKVAIKGLPSFDEWRAAQTPGRGDFRAYNVLVMRFRREALAWIRLGSHPHIVWAMHMLEIGSQPHLVMEYADAGDLRDRLGREPMPLPRTIGLAIQFCDGMEHAGAHGLVHRDIKPGNVLLTREGILKIADFGLVTLRAMDSDDVDGAIRSSVQSALSIAAAGTPAYMAPEQFRGLRYATLRSDIFSFGAMLHEMITGRMLFGTRTALECAADRAVLPPPDGEAERTPDDVSDNCNYLSVFHRPGEFFELARLDDVLASFLLAS